MTDEELQLAINLAASQSFAAFAKASFKVIEPATPFEDNWHIDCIAEHLEASLVGELPWLIINIPPRFLKSVLVAQMYPAWVLQQQPWHQFIGASYAHSLAERNVMRTRQIINSDWYQSAYDVKISQDQNQKDFFTTTQSGQYKGTGIGGTITGFGAHTLMVDDPINPQEAASDTIRNNAINEIRSTLFSRFNDRKSARFIMIMQRLHEKDPTGDLLKDERFYLLKLPAEAKKQIVVNLHDKSWKMEEGELLSSRLPKKELEELRNDLGDYNFSGQYYQEPVPVGGGEFKDKWVHYYQSGGVRPSEMNIVILCDPSGGDEVNKKKKKTSDFTSMVVVGLASDNNYYLLDIVRDRLNPTERINKLFELHRKWNELSGKPPKVGYEKYGLMTDTYYIQQKQHQDNYRFELIVLGGSVAKEERIRVLIPDMQNSRWYFPANLLYTDCEGRTFDLVHELVYSEMASFPRARFDDMIDALARVYEKDLCMVFPKAKTGLKQRMLNEIQSQNEEEGWMSY